MRISITPSLVFLAISSGALAQLAGTHAHGGAHDLGRTRKTLAYGPDIPHAVFNTHPVSVDGLLPGTNPSADPFETASTFVRDLLSGEGQLSERSSFELRSDSYTDDNTGVTHAYFKQLINGLPVSDGHINVNIKDGVVLSYGDSFYRGDVPTVTSSPAIDKGLYASQKPLDAHCQALEQTMQTSFTDDLRALGEGRGQVRVAGINRMSHLSQRLERLFSTHCLNMRSAPRLTESRSDGEVSTAAEAALRFMMAAAPTDELAEDILTRYDDYANSISLTFEPGLMSGSMDAKLVGVPGTVNPVKVNPAYVQVPNGEGKTELALVWKLEVEMQDNWYEAAVTMHHPLEIVSVLDWASDASDEHIAPVKKPKKEERAEHGTYNIHPWGVNDPECGNRTIEKEPIDEIASPIGWHTIPASSDPLDSARSQFSSKDTYHNYTTTVGNNVFAHENWEGRNNWMDNYRPDAGNSLVFDYTYDPKVRDSADSLAEAKKYINATVTQLFYTVNRVHDLYYRYGFDEKAGNFQQDNFDRGGLGNDGVIANAQDGSGYNNANFMTPPDGQNGRCRMYLWNTAQPYRDGDMEAGIVIHELSHGLSTRLTGGPANSGCLGWGESGGMGEGWGDFLATLIRSNSTYSDYAMGSWAANRPTGIRNYVYSLNETINPSMYKTLDKPGYWGVHAIGEVWAEMLWVVAQRLITKHGYSDSLFPPAPSSPSYFDFYRSPTTDSLGRTKPLVPKHGNSLIVQLVLNGMKLQKCMPSFFDARDAIIQADQVLTGGENYCELWQGFASRGLGVDARVEGRTPWGGGIRSNGYEVPEACSDESTPEDPETPGDGDEDDDEFTL